MSDVKTKKPGKTPVQAAWIGIKARNRAQKDGNRPHAEPHGQDVAQSKRASGRARLFQLLSNSSAGNAPKQPDRKGKTIKVAKVSTRESRQRELLRRHADAIEKIRARKALAAERDALVADALEQDDFNFPAPA